MSEAKSTVEEIRARFDADVERFSRLETGQSATMDAPLVLDLVAEAAAATTPGARRILDVGCGAGNFSLKLLERLPGAKATLLDLSRPMLDRAAERVGAASPGPVAIQADLREADLGEGAFDVIVAAAVLHHLRDDEEWRAAYSKLFRALSPGGSLWVFDLTESDAPGARAVLWDHYARYLEGLGGPAYRDTVLAYIEKEDTPRPLLWQLELMRAAGFAGIEVLHKHGPFAAFGGSKPEAAREACPPRRDPPS